jgi:hypothetical protein
VTWVEVDADIRREQVARLLVRNQVGGRDEPCPLVATGLEGFIKGFLADVGQVEDFDRFRRACNPR